MRARVHLKQDKPAEARRLTQALIDEQPDKEDAYWALFEVALHEKKYDEAVALLRLLKKRFDSDPADLTQLPEYAGFVKSPQYREWSGGRVLATLSDA